MAPNEIARPPTRVALIAAFAAVYLIWGSTYLAIRFAVETLPPFLMAGARFICAGLILYIPLRLSGTPRPTVRQWRGALWIGGLLLLGGNGGVVWSEQFVPSSLAALMVAIVPLWMVLLDWLRPGGVAPTRPVIFGLAFGSAGVALLVGPVNIGERGALELIGTIVLILASLSWSFGSVRSKHAGLPSSPWISTAMQMIGGGTLLLIAGLVSGEWMRFDVGAISTRSVAAWVYLLVFGSIIGFSAYVWLLRAVSPALVATYAYVNPIVAVFLGWVFAGEVFTVRAMIAAVLIVVAVALITTFRVSKPVTERTSGAGRGDESSTAALEAVDSDAPVGADSAAAVAQSRP